MQLDYASILRAGQGLVPNLREQMMQDEQMAMQRQQFDMQRKQFEIAQDTAERERQRQAAFEEARDNALLSGNPADIQRLRLQFPEFTKDMKDAFDTLDDNRKRSDLTQLGSIFSRGQSGDYTGAAAILEARIAADKAAGEDVAMDEAILDALKSGDAVQQRAAMGQVGILLASVEPDKFAETYGKLNPTEATPATIREYDARVAKFGKAAADAWLATQDTKLIAGQPGGQIFAMGPSGGGVLGVDGNVTAQGGGDPSGSGAGIPATGKAIEQAALSAVPGAIVTSRQRSPAKNRQVGGTANSFHLTDQARDFVPPKGMTMGQLASTLKRAMPGFDVINEGDHVHVEPSSRRQASGPKRVRSKQEYEKLPAGSTYIAPDGSQRVKS
jgi:hypothetical protein